MLLLALDSSATAVSAAVLEDGSLLGEFYGNTKQTHSQTLLPMVAALLSSVEKTVDMLELLAVTVGPGSFTGIRIGVSSVKGLAFDRDIPCCGISTLEAIAYTGSALEGKVLCCVMDARCGQVYNGIFRITGGRPHRLCPDRALSIEALALECKDYGRELVLIGDGSGICGSHPAFADAQLAPEPIRYQHASGVALAAAARWEERLPPQALLPLYLRLPQAERELKKRTEEGRKPKL